MENGDIAFCFGEKACGFGEKWTIKQCFDIAR